MTKATKKDKRRLFVLMIVFIPLLVVFLSNMISYWSVIFSNIKEKKELETEYQDSLKKEKELTNEINKLQDEEYIARYAREKYLYSKDGEIIIKVEE